MLSLLGLRAYPKNPYCLFLWLLGLGIGIEVAQAYTGWRRAEIWDLVADAVGVAIVFVLVKVKQSRKGL